jgi:DNA polymerase V
VNEAASSEAGACGSGEVFALRVLGDSMAPEFTDGDIVIIEPDGVVRDGSFVLANPEGEWTLRQLGRLHDGWVLRALNPSYAQQPLGDLSAVRGVVIQKAVPGRRRLNKRYI